MYNRNLFVTMSRGDILRPGESREIHEKGMPVHGKFRQFGSLIINFNIIFPSSLKPEEMECMNIILIYFSFIRSFLDPVLWLIILALIKILPSETLNEKNKVIKKSDDQEIILQNIDPNSFKEERNKSKNAYEGDIPNQGEPQCQQQWVDMLCLEFSRHYRFPFLRAFWLLMDTSKLL